ncbi:hypothetical protein ACM64Y_18680 [Novispirillum sp. DQ9]|uniref:hypothetical protein n=1 Tax=Novispirillum sp. DQ9 TaxID=3398612 RepID=UPI003C7AF817
MRALIAALAVALIVGTEVTAGVAVLDGIIFWSDIDTAKALLWVAVAAGVVAGLLAGRRTLLKERSLPQGAISQG